MNKRPLKLSIGFTGAVLALLISAAEVPAQDNTPQSASRDAKADCESLLNEAIPSAKKMLKEHGEFYPYGYVMKPSGEIALKAGYDGTEHPKSQVIIDLLTDGFKQDAAAGRVKATALVYDIRVIPPGASEKSDAIAVALDHRDNYSVVVILPYVLNHGEISVGTAFAKRGDSHVFAPRMSN